MRCGTGAVHRALGSHPGIHASDRKEIRFFDVRYGNGEAWYRRHFPTDTQARPLEEQTAALCRSASRRRPTCSTRRCPPASSAWCPARGSSSSSGNPSHGRSPTDHLAVRKRWEDLSFEEAIEREPERLAGVEERQLADPEFRSAAHRHLSYVSRGLYARQLERWLEQFPAEQIQVQKSEDLYAEPDRVLGEICEFIGAPPLPAVQLGWVTRARRPAFPTTPVPCSRSASPKPNARLYELLGRDLGW